ncbi:hypothetical protein M885DRAFT_498792 [Pelagophyceae sp. CCMP2097]|nr:hypothetical protein M885DRAFT_498792 [Pelagophyceae sp. CCMP2097]
MHWPVCGFASAAAFARRRAALFGGIVSLQRVPHLSNSRGSFAQLRGLDGPAVCGFGAQPNTIVVVGGDGSFLTAGFGGGGDCGRISFAKFVRGEAEEADEARLEFSARSLLRPVEKPR